jgi:hypothetical protein
MKKLSLALSSVALIIAAAFSTYSQQTGKSVTNRPAPVAALCTQAVPAETCKSLVTALGMYQQLPPLLSIQFVIADKAAFEQEKERILTRFQNWLKSLPQGSGASPRLINRPFAHSSFDNLLFELDDDGNITKVYMDTSGFQELKGVNTQGQIETKEGTFDSVLGQEMTLFAIGYIEGCSDGERRMLNRLSVHQ